MHPRLSPGSRYRGWLIALLFGASFLSYFDRQALPVLKTTLDRMLQMTGPDYAFAVNVFTAAYALAYLGSGWFVDRMGPRLSLTAFAALWSAAAIGCGVAATVPSFTAMRAVLGLAEPGLQPVTIRAATAWAPEGERGLFMSLCGVGSSVGAIAAPPLVAWLTLALRWRAAFLLPGLAGLALAVLWFATYRDPRSVETERDSHAKLVPPTFPWRTLWKTREVWGVILCRLISDPVWYYCLFWFPAYLQEHRGSSLAQLGRVGWLPFLAANVGGIGLSALSDRLARASSDPLLARKRLLAWLSLGGVAAAFIPFAAGTGPTLALFCILGVVCSAWLYTLAPIIADAFSLGNVASVWAMAGAFGAAGAIVFNTLIARWVGASDARPMFFALAALQPCAALLLLFLVRRPQGTVFAKFSAPSPLR